MVKKLSELARTVQFKQEDCITVMADISQMIDHYRSKPPFVMNLTIFDESTKENESLTLVNAKNDAILASTSIPPTITERKMSMLEYNRRRKPKTARLNQPKEIITRSSSKMLKIMMLVVLITIWLL